MDRITGNTFSLFRSRDLEVMVSGTHLQDRKMPQQQAQGQEGLSLSGMTPPSPDQSLAQ